ncbi:MAG: hypothetical protein AAF267_22625 [Deinococcota bacterium]
MSKQIEYLFDESYYNDKRVFAVTHYRHLNAVCKQIVNEGLPLMVKDLQTQELIHLETLAQLDAWLKEHQGMTLAEALSTTVASK